MKTACVLYAGSEFNDSSRAVETYLSGKGYTVTRRDIGDTLTPAILLTLPRQCEVSVWLSHGGWDGPMVFEGDYGGFGQIDPSETPVRWELLKTAMASHVKKNGVLISHSCHSAGSNKYESTEAEKSERWVQQVAQDVQIYAVGVEGSTASANRSWAVEFVKFALEGTRNRQASRAYKPGGTRATSWTGWFNQAGR